MEVDLKQLESQAKNEIAGVKDDVELSLLKSKYLGSNGVLRSFFKEIGKLPEDRRKKQGADLNTLQRKITGLIQNKTDELSIGQSEKNLKQNAEELDFEIPKIGHLHPITQTIRMLNKLFISLGYSVMDGPEIETDEYNFQRLNVPKNHPARDMQDTIYIKEPDFLLRTQTSSVEVRVLANYKPPMKFVVPGRVYRNEKANKSNHFIFHQYQGTAILERTSLKDLFGTFSFLFKKMYGPETVVRYRNKYYPEVEPGVGADLLCFNCKGKGCPLCKGVGWIEMGGAGIIHPNVLKMAGINPKKWMGFAFGLGLDRWVMAKYKINDIRTLLGGNLAYKYYEGENTL